jgi:hypothetical protein
MRSQIPIEEITRNLNQMKRRMRCLLALFHNSSSCEQHSCAAPACTKTHPSINKQTTANNDTARINLATQKRTVCWLLFVAAMRVLWQTLAIGNGDGRDEAQAVERVAIAVHLAAQRMEKECAEAVDDDACSRQQTNGEKQIEIKNKRVESNRTNERVFPCSGSRCNYNKR